MSRQSERRSTLNLLLDLVYQAEALRLPERLRPSGVDLPELLEVLEARSAQSFFGNAELCLSWFLSPSSPLGDEEKAKLVRLNDLRSGKRDFQDVFNEMISEIKRSDS